MLILHLPKTALGETGGEEETWVSCNRGNIQIKLKGSALLLKISHCYNSALQVLHLTPLTFMQGML